ncbi:MAG: hypothetical protein KAU20_05620 [Nanoarchaeota archaeon]|nr:hypothetical protein [Nanoarchaeota archaeon]
MKQTIEIKTVKSHVEVKSDCPFCGGTGKYLTGKLKGFTCVECMVFSDPVMEKTEIEITKSGIFI